MLGGGFVSPVAPGDDQELDAAPPLFPGDLTLHGVVRPQGHGHELANPAIAGVDAVEPRLTGHDQVVLHLAIAPRAQPIAPRLAADGVDLTDCDLHRAWRIRIRAGERDPQRLSLVHRDEDAAALAPRRGHTIGIGIHGKDGERAQARRQRVVPSVVRDPQRTFEADTAVPELECVVPERGTEGIGSVGHWTISLTAWVARS